MEDNFKERIEENLIDRKREDVIYFAWTCAVRCLPFLVKDSFFNLWYNEDMQKHLYAVFNALDFVFAGDAAAYPNAHVVTAASAGGPAAVAAAAAYAAAYNAAYDAAYPAAYAAAKLNFLSGNKYLNLLINESKTIRKDAKFSVKNEIYDTNSLNKIDEFLTVLRKNDCHYWADLYKQIFKEGCIIDEPNSNKLNTKQALAQRLNVPEEIEAKGAAAVSRYLLKLSKGSKRLNEARIIILGKKGAGKTSTKKQQIPN